jgi:uncharacterized protein YukE|mmetsp:Transcript_11385/g.20944  ORF Transcript_11385/g.20944 Transcript_11385/m.20944 type:complete len:404 (-) Transcript_11385:506-1717(-)
MEANHPIDGTKADLTPQGAAEPLQEAASPSTEERLKREKARAKKAAKRVQEEKLAKDSVFQRLHERRQVAVEHQSAPSRQEWDNVVKAATRKRQQAETSIYEYASEQKRLKKQLAQLQKRLDALPDVEDQSTTQEKYAVKEEQLQLTEQCNAISQKLDDLQERINRTAPNLSPQEVAVMRGVAARRVDPMIQGAVQTKQLERLWEQLAKDGNRPDPNVPVAAETLKPGGADRSGPQNPSPAPQPSQSNMTGKFLFCQNGQKLEYLLRTKGLSWLAERINDLATDERHIGFGGLKTLISEMKATKTNQFAVMERQALVQQQILADLKSKGVQQSKAFPEAGPSIVPLGWSKWSPEQRLPSNVGRSRSQQSGEVKPLPLWMQTQPQAKASPKLTPIHQPPRPSSV